MIQSYADYYPFGEQLPARNTTSNYRYAFQGQEKDPETGMEAFQLRLWDGRIGRWLSPDPYGQYASPYLGMGNNPINGIDINGGWFGDPPTEKGAPGATYFDPSDNTTFLADKNGNWGSVYSLDNITIKNNYSNSFNMYNFIYTGLTPIAIGIMYLDSRMSGYIEYGGEMKSDFTGSSIGKNGVLYGVESNPWAPGPSINKTPTQFLKDLKTTGSILSTYSKLQNVDENNIEIRTVDTIHFTLHCHTKRVDIETGKMTIFGNFSNVERRSDSVENRNKLATKFYKNYFNE